MSLNVRTKTMGNMFLDLLFPANLYCICCGKIIDESRTYSMCNDCIKSIRWVAGRSCGKCGKAMNENNPKDICFECSTEERFFDRGFICSEYGVHEKTLLYELKYASQGYIGEVLGEIAYDKLSAELGEDVLSSSFDMVVPVPIFKLREQRRGFNQAELIAKSFAKRAGLAVEKDLVVRTRQTEAMKGLNAAERRANISGAFEIRTRKLPLISGANILIVDDIYTTGATIDEIASVLKNPKDVGDSPSKSIDVNPIKDAGGNPLRGAARVDFITFAGASDRFVQ